MSNVLRFLFRIVADTFDYFSGGVVGAMAGLVISRGYTGYAPWLFVLAIAMVMAAFSQLMKKFARMEFDEMKEASL